MTLEQRAAFMDQLKLPIEEAPRDGESIIGCNAKGMFGLVWWSEEGCRWVHWLSDGQTATPTHFLPLPVAGPVEFDVVPKGLVEKAYKEGFRQCAQELTHYGDDESGVFWDLSNSRQLFFARDTE